MTTRHRIAVTLGDPNGIGPEIAVKASASFAGSDLQPVLVGDAFIIEDYARRHAPDMALRRLDEEGADDGRCLTYMPVDSMAREDFQPGTVSAAAGRATVSYVTAAVRLATEGEVKAIVGCPHSETAINSAGIPFSGYPGLIGRLLAMPEDRVFLMLVAAGLRIAHVTLHESVRQALERLDARLVVDAGVAAHRAAKKLGITKPTLGVFGINPHAGEDGLFGDEDERITKPAVAKLRSLGIEAHGPTGADLLLGQRRHDVYLAMFHDQGHIPIKLLSPLRASALSIGTDLLFSSVGHGSAFDIAGKGVADPVSVIETLNLLHQAANQEPKNTQP